MFKNEVIYRSNNYYEIVPEGMNIEVILNFVNE